MSKVNPFKPHSPINSAMFAGREVEVKKLEGHLIQTRFGSPANFIITGERGIGKSSLLSYLKSVASGEEALRNGEKLRFLVIETDIDSTTTQAGLIKKIEMGLRFALGSSEAVKVFLKDFVDVVMRMEAAGVKIRDSGKSADPDNLIEEFSYTFGDTVKRLCRSSKNPLSAKYDGALILIDEADNASDDLALGSFLKLFLERLQKRGCPHVMFGLAGLPHLHEVLVSSHKSSLRIFDDIALDRLTEEEVHEAVTLCLATANKVNDEPMTIDDDAILALQHLSDGYPHFIQQFGYSAYAADGDNRLSSADVASGAFDAGGALDQIGESYYRDDFYNKVQKESHRQVLRIMSQDLDAWVPKSKIRAKFKGTDKSLNAAIRLLRQKRIIFTKEGTPGVYRLQHKGFAYWITLRATPTVAITDLLKGPPPKSSTSGSFKAVEVDADYSDESLSDLEGSYEGLDDEDLAALDDYPGDLDEDNLAADSSGWNVD